MIVLAEHEAFAAAFSELYASGMQLIDQASGYFSGEGRQARQLLGAEAALLYSGEVKRLSHKLMQVASWLLLERAAREEDMASHLLEREKKKVILDANPFMHDHPAWAELPELFRTLAEETLHFVERVQHMDRKACSRVPDDRNGNPVRERLHRLKNAFDAG